PKLDLERLGLLDLRRPDVAGSIAYEQIVNALAVRDLHTFVVHLDLFVGLEIIPDEHLVPAANQGGTELHRREPVDVHMTDDLVGVVDRDERHVSVAVQVLPAGRHHRLGLLVDNVVHDRQIMRREIPYHADVVLKQPEVYARGIEIVQRTQRALVHDLADLAHGATEEKRVIDHYPQVPLGGQLDQLFGLARVRRERLLDEHVLAVHQRRFGQLVMGPDGRNHRDGVDQRRRQHRAKIRGALDRRIRSLGAAKRLGTLVTYRDNLALLEAVQVPDDVRAPVPVADDADAHRVRAVGPFESVQSVRLDTWRAGRSGLMRHHRYSVVTHFELTACVSTGRNTRAGLPATIVRAGTSRVTTLPAPTMAYSPIVTWRRIVAPDPIEAPRSTTVGSALQSLWVCSSPDSVVARGYESLMKVTPWPTNTWSPIVTPSQMNVWLEILHRRPTL